MYRLNPSLQTISIHQLNRSVNTFVCVYGRNDIHFVLRIFVSRGCDFMFILSTFIFVLFCIECISFCLIWAYNTFTITIAWFLKEGKRRERDSRCIYINLWIWGDGNKMTVTSMLFCFMCSKMRGKTPQVNQ